MSKVNCAAEPEEEGITAEWCSEWTRKLRPRQRTLRVSGLEMAVFNPCSESTHASTNLFHWLKFWSWVRKEASKVTLPWCLQEQRNKWLWEEWDLSFISKDIWAGPLISHYSYFYKITAYWIAPFVTSNTHTLNPCGFSNGYRSVWLFYWSGWGQSFSSSFSYTWSVADLAGMSWCWVAFTSLVLDWFLEFVS